MRKRSNGEGSISQRENGTWLAQVTIDGQRVSKTRPTKKEAQEWINNITGQVRSGLTYAATKTTISGLLSEWLEIKRGAVRPTTYHTYETNARLYVYPRLGLVKTQEVNAARVQAFYNGLIKDSIGKRSLESVHTIILGMFAYARKVGLVAQNWAELVEIPQAPTMEMRVWSEDQVAHFLSLYPSVFYKLEFSTGMRISEILGLQWRDIDFSLGTLHIRRQVKFPVGGGYVFGPPKTKRGDRIVHLGNELLRELKADQSGDNDLIFATKNHTPYRPYEINSKFRANAAAAGLPVIRFHDIRHTVASILLLHGEPPVRVAAIIGDTITTLLETYSHYIPDDQERAARILSNLVNRNALQQKNPTTDDEDRKPPESSTDIRLS